MTRPDVTWRTEGTFLMTRVHLRCSACCKNEPFVVRSCQNCPVNDLRGTSQPFCPIDAYAALHFGGSGGGERRRGQNTIALVHVLKWELAKSCTWRGGGDKGLHFHAEYKWSVRRNVNVRRGGPDWVLVLPQTHAARRGLKKPGHCVVVGSNAATLIQSGSSRSLSNRRDFKLVCWSPCDRSKRAKYVCKERRSGFRRKR